MKVILLHNAKAGGGEQPAAERLVEEIREAGHEVLYQTTLEKGSKWTMLEPADLVIAAGGDGTVRKAALAVAGRGVPLAILPLGTANNLAKTFGIFAPASEIIHNLATARRLRLDVALASGPWGKIPFVESAGAGLLAQLIARLSKAAGSSAPSLAQSVQHLLKLLETYPAQAWSAAVDEKKLSGDFLLAEAMNARSVGPNLGLAPEADPGDGLLDFVFLRAESREKFARYLDPKRRRPGTPISRSAHPDTDIPPPVEVVRGKTLRLRCEGPMHIDDFTWRDEGKASAEITLEIHIPGDPIEILAP